MKIFRIGVFFTVVLLCAWWLWPFNSTKVDANHNTSEGNPTIEPVSLVGSRPADISRSFNHNINLLESQILNGREPDPKICQAIESTLRSIEKVDDQLAMVAQMPRWLYRYMDQYILELSSKIFSVPLEEKGNTGDYYRMMMVAANTPTAAMADLLFNELGTLPEYDHSFDDSIVVKRRHESRGDIGQLAKTIVTNGQHNDPGVLDRYGQLLVDSDGSRQRVLVWALGEASKSYADFELLMDLRDRISDGSVRMDIDAALAKISRSLNSTALITYEDFITNEPEFGPFYFEVNPMTREELESYAESQGIDFEKSKEALLRIGLGGNNGS